MKKSKTCTQCRELKDLATGFYLCAGNWRSECKSCTILRNTLYQKKVKAWRYRPGGGKNRKAYMRDYYNKNKEKYAQYRSEFRLRYPGYYREYTRKRKEM